MIWMQRCRWLRRAPWVPLLAVVINQLLCAQTTSNRVFRVAWDLSPDSDVTQYKLYWSDLATSITNTLTALNTNSAALSGLAAGHTYNIVVTAITSSGFESVPSNQLTYTVPSAFFRAYLFYNNSAWDNNDPAANASDDGAIAWDKTPLVTGAVATFSNYTSYSRGINGIMLDIAGISGQLGPADFTFRAGNDNSPSSWPTAPAPSLITVRRAAGTNGSDRVTLIWPDKTIWNEWLDVTILATPNTGLAAPTRFFFGNAIGEAGNSPSDAKVDPADILLARANQRTALNPAAIDNPYDYNRDQRVDPADQLVARANLTSVLNALRLIDLSLATTVSATSPSVSLSQEKVRTGASTALQVLAAASDEFGLRMRLQLPSNFGAALELLWSADIGAPDWQPVPPSWVRYNGGPSCEIELPKATAGERMFFRVQPPSDLSAK